MDRTPENLACYAALIQQMAEAHDAVCEDDAVSLLLGIASRWAANRVKLTSRFELIEDVLAEAVKLTPPGDSIRLSADTISRTLVDRRHRNARVEDRMVESIVRGTIMIDTAGSVVGQVNGLVVRNLGDHEFGAPTRITARASVGRRGVINIERDTELGGPIQQKGVMVLQGFLAGHFARRIPLSFNCSITFEQSYSGVEGGQRLARRVARRPIRPIRRALALGTSPSPARSTSAAKPNRSAARITRSRGSSAPASKAATRTVA